jgi:hypothetical protein
MTNLATKYHDCHSIAHQDYWADMFFAQNAQDLNLWPSYLKLNRGHLLTMTNLPTKLSWLSLKNSSIYRADMVFVQNATVTLTFDLLTRKFIWVIYWPWPTFLPSIMTVTQKLFKILSWHGFCTKCYSDLDLWHTDLEFYKGHLLTMINLSTKYHLSLKNFSRYWADIMWLTDGQMTGHSYESYIMGLFLWSFLIPYRSIFNPTGAIFLTP